MIKYYELDNVDGSHILTIYVGVLIVKEFVCIHLLNERSIGLKLNHIENLINK